LIGGRWTTAGKARARLRAAAEILERSPDQVDHDAARLVRRNWCAVAARPSWADDIIARANRQQRAARRPAAGRLCSADLSEDTLGRVVRDGDW